MLYKYRIEIKEIADVIESGYEDLHCVFSSQDVSQLDIFIDATEELGLKCCKNVTRKCRSQLPKDGKSSCELCLAKEREKDHAKRGTIVITETEKQCSNCSKMCPLDHFNGVHNDTKTCQSCRDYFKKMDEKRDKEHVNELARKNEKKPERV
jgi:hypothetical protein